MIYDNYTYLKLEDTRDYNETRGRLVIKKLLLLMGIKESNIHFTTYKYDSIDLYFEYKNKEGKTIKFVGEIKNRKKKYLNSDVILEKQKYDGIIRRKNELKANNAIFFSIYDDIVYLFSVPKMIKDNELRKEEVWANGLLTARIIKVIWRVGKDRASYIFQLINDKFIKL